MTSKINTILIVGATSGIGEAFARRFHSMGKKVIIAGRRADKLTALKTELSGIETVEWDIADFNRLPGQVSEILKSHPTLDTVFINAGIQKSFSLLDPTTSTPESVVAEINTNFTAPVLLTQLFIPHLLSLASAGKPANLLVTSSALAFFPFGFYPVYAPTKAAVHSFIITLRQQLNYAPPTVQKNFSIVEIVPPYTDTGIDSAHRERVNELQGGAEKAFKPMPLADYIDQAFASLDELDDEGNLKKEVGVGFGQMGIETWRASFGKALEGMGVKC
ncbi:putative oxidoreductase DltE [Lachnellula cervina]|uniref:Putative oxidoreductase DltE n=1 Tax=Lachnellula cervina TaxID=1316786 RepID=A0A7D8YKT6_9HELO|nr:putative oxidoreductase DltE [Lachnellula cervina]